MAAVRDLTFEILWLDSAPENDGVVTAEVIARDTVKRHDLSDAITAAANMLKGSKGGAKNARGFVVKRKRDGD